MSTTSRTQENEDFKFYMSTGKDMGRSGQALRDWVQEKVDDTKEKQDRKEKEKQDIKEKKEEQDRLDRFAREEQERKDRLDREEKQQAHGLQMAQIGSTNSSPALGASARTQAHTFMPKWTEAEPEVWLDRAERVITT
ncbi:uncharacterized protein [Macrobrachium rosenbergii]|uniref:uncharacterized protein n=1 Tax=Macrobrachium rosenbergii TaxID=79674 RepID=UPI0034D41357